MLWSYTAPVICACAPAPPGRAARELTHGRCAVALRQVLPAPTQGGGVLVVEGSDLGSPDALPIITIGGLACNVTSLNCSDANCTAIVSRLTQARVRG